MIAGYVGYAVALFALFAYIKFPTQQIRAFVLSTLSSHGLEQVHIGSVQPLLPAGLTLNEVRVAQDVNGQALELMHMPALQVRVRTLRPFANPLRIAFEGGLYGGMLTGTAGWEHNGAAPALHIRVDLQDIQPAAHPLATTFGSAMLEGKLAGSVTLQLSGRRWGDGDGRLTLQSDDGKVSGLEIGGVRIPTLTYERFVVECTLQQRNVMVKEFRLRGRDWQVDAQGRVSLHDRLRQSPVDLTLRLRVPEALEHQLGPIGILLKQSRNRRGFTDVKINGTIEHPNPVLPLRSILGQPQTQINSPQKEPS